MNNERRSFRDPDGFVFRYQDAFYRVVYDSFAADLSLIEAEGLLNASFMVTHSLPAETEREKVLNHISADTHSRKVIRIFRLEKLACVTHPWEWTPAMLRDAALFTLTLQQTLLAKGLTLKDATPHNIQFVKGKPVLIDLLSLKKTNGQIYPWVPYGQFLKQFVYPLTLVKYKKVSSMSILQSFPEGIEKQYIAANVPLRSYFSIYEMLNIHLFKKIGHDRISVQAPVPATAQLKNLLNLVDFNASYLGNVLKEYRKEQSHWKEYYETNTSTAYTNEKLRVFTEMADSCDVESALDLGANTGKYSTVLAHRFSKVISVEKDALCCELIYQQIQETSSSEGNWNVIVADLLYPTPSIGWMNTEREGLLTRIRSGLVAALAIIHHLYFSGSIDFVRIADLFAYLSQRYLVVEFIEPEDTMVQTLAAVNNTRLNEYTLANFMEALSVHFSVIQSADVSVTRKMFLLESKMIS